MEADYCLDSVTHKSAVSHPLNCYSQQLDTNFQLTEQFEGELIEFSFPYSASRINCLPCLTFLKLPHYYLRLTVQSDNQFDCYILKFLQIQLIKNKTNLFYFNLTH